MRGQLAAAGVVGGSRKAYVASEACTEMEERDMLMLRNNYHRRGQAPGTT